MKKMKTKAELKSVGDFFKIGAAPSGGQNLSMLPLPLTCGLCYKVKIIRTFLTVLTKFIFRISILNPRLRTTKKTIHQLKEYPGFRSLREALKKT